MTEPASYDIKVNGEIETVIAPAEETLLTVLRERLNLTGAKRGCDQGVCGTCTVLINGEPVRACLTLAALCEGVEITTIEGLGRPDQLSAVQQSFIDAGGIQCGFCASGMILTVSSILNNNPEANEDDIREAISGNICRCTGYAKIVEAAVNAAGQMGGASR
ncbi:MAG: (2Fe-2S)-binding protein [Rhodospirillales bacterium]|jgi:carbon-monoxide dehydrogenase small subunit|nr:(2Fe-2S)-binding protein [Rhodospirillaceae bacterium]MDP6426909.1 (2Fe-2S)-binding protein [Rhodospirillales bacterium]MDP6645390.1 (2Fe-2S)-binding protein [Rhodospirillales bacterium]|tara:strand:+ start:2429 stop:2914 length:486 start_codon:yes stop_codon:yes gene_type:complete